MSRHTYTVHAEMPFVELPVEIAYAYTPGEPATRWDAGCGPTVEILSVTMTLPDKSRVDLGCLAPDVERTLTDDLVAGAADDIADARAEAMEARWEARREMQREDNAA